MSFTIEWVLENKHGSVLRIDLTRRSDRRYTNDEAVSASMFFYGGDEEGSVLGYFDYVASEHGRGVISFKYTDKPAEWTTFVGDIIARWDPEWRVTSTPLCRLGTWNKHREALAFNRLSSSNLLVVQHLARIWGAIEQFKPDHATTNANFVLSSAREGLRRLVARQNDEFASFVQHMR